MSKPLACLLRPGSIDEIVGQDHLVGPSGILRKMKNSKKLLSHIYYGPPGSGKTTLAYCLSQDLSCAFEKLDAANCKVSEIRDIIGKADSALKAGTETILFVDEIHRMNKNIQDVLLSAVENGTIILIGATTEKPVFSVNAALLSRMMVYELKPINDKSLIKMLMKVIGYYKNNGKNISVGKVAMKLINKSNGDARKLVTIMETIAEVILPDGGEITDEMVDIVMPGKHLYLDPSGKEHFDIASAFQNSIQNSDVDQAIYFLALWLESGENEAYIARRILISAAEDAPLNFRAQIAANNAYIAAKEIGYPECKISMALAVIEITKSPRNKIANNAINNAIEFVKNNNVTNQFNAGDHDQYFKLINEKFVFDWPE